MDAAISKEQIRAIHVLKSRAGLDEETYRDFLMRETGQRSSVALTEVAAGRVIEALKTLSGPSRDTLKGGSNPNGALDLSGPYAGICRALWISGYNLGVFEHREDVALVAFVRRQTKIDHLNWVRDAEDAAKVIEALKGWLNRAAGVDWQKSKGDRRDNPDRIIAAQLRLLGAERGTAGALVELWELGRAKPTDKTRLMQALGFEIRRRKANP